MYFDLVQFQLKRQNEIKAEIEMAMSLNTEFRFRTWMDRAKGKVQQKGIYCFKFRTLIPYDLYVAFWAILETVYKEICEGFTWTDKQTCKSRKQSCNEQWELRPKHWRRLAESWVSQHAWRTAVLIPCFIWEPCVASVVRRIPCWSCFSLSYQNCF